MPGVPLPTSQVVQLVLAGLLTGNELCTWAFVHPSADRLGRDAEVLFEQAMTRRMLVPMGGLMTATLAAGVWAAREASARRRPRLGFGTACYAGMLAITLAGNMPLNVATLRAGRDIDPGSWRATRRSWNRLHLVRNALNVGGLVTLAAAAHG